MQEIVRSLEASDSWDASPERMQWLDERLTTYRTLKRKYGSSVEEVLENLQTWREQLNELKSRDQRLDELLVAKKSSFARWSHRVRRYELAVKWWQIIFRNVLPSRWLS